MPRNTRNTRTAPSAPSAPSAPANLWESVTVQSAPPVTRESKNGNRLEGTPFVQWLTDSRDSKEARRIGPLAEKQGKEAEQLLRLAAKKIGSGVKIKVAPAGNGRVTVTFQASARKQFAESQRGTCQECGKSVVVRRKDGKISPHGPRDNRCSGSEQDPA